MRAGYSARGTVPPLRPDRVGEGVEGTAGQAPESLMAELEHISRILGRVMSNLTSQSTAGR